MQKTQKITIKKLQILRKHKISEAIKIISYYLKITYFYFNFYLY